MLKTNWYNFIFILYHLNIGRSLNVEQSDVRNLYFYTTWLEIGP